jgi:ribonucleoside-diphosphate reductase alpha chain
MYQPTGFANTIFTQRYAINAEESFKEACERVANHIAVAENGSREKWARRFTEVMVNNRFIPAGRIWYGSGRMKGQLLNCFVVPTEDSREGWGKTVSDMLIISGTGGGVGINFSPLRPRGTPIRGTGGEATGAVSLMEVINETGEVIKAGGGRRTALMQCLRYDHADILEFLHKKFNKVDLTEENLQSTLMDTFPNLPREEVTTIVESFGAGFEGVLKSLIKYQLDQRLKNSNVSVLVDDGFFELVHNNEDIIFEWNGKETSRIPAKEVWDIIVHNSWESGEPGILNIGLANEMNNIWYHKPLISTNPCGEIWLEEYGCCDLGAINLVEHIDSKTGDMDWDMLADTVTVGVRFLDDVLDVNVYPLPQIEKNCQNVRRIGLGIMGLGHALIKLGVRYDNAEGRKKVEQIFNFIKKRAYESSTYLAAEKGSFPAFDADKFLDSGFCKTLTNGIRAKIHEYGIRNCAILTIAPTGTTSIMAATSSGIEPVFSPGYKRRYYASKEGSNDRVIEEEIVIDPLFQQLYEDGYDLDSFVSAHEIDVEDHLRMQSIVQKHIDNAVSKTINLPNDYPVERYGSLLQKYGPKLKGTTVYRSGSRGNEPLTPLSVEDAIMHLKNKGVIIGVAQSDCPSGICEISEAPIQPNLIEYSV